MSDRPKPQANHYQTVEHPFAPYVRILGKGKRGSRSLTFAEAQHAFGLILDGEVLDVQLGAFLMLLRVKEESADELAGFVTATRERLALPALYTWIWTGRVMPVSVSIILGFCWQRCCWRGLGCGW